MPHEIFNVTAPALTPKSAPLELPTTLAPSRVLEVKIRIPKGHAGLTGIRIAIAHTVVVPMTTSAWIIGDSREATYRIVNVPDSGAWSAFVYNTDTRDHYWAIEYEYEELSLRLPSDLNVQHAGAHKPFIPAAQLGSVERQQIKIAEGQSEPVVWVPSNTYLPTWVRLP